MSLCIQAAITKYLRVNSLQSREIFLLTVLEAGNLKIKTLVDLVADEERFLINDVF
jgi:hypothetical protein